jgi:ferrous iron transport protein B
LNTLTIGLVGNPNCGKTTLFNGLTGAAQRVGNWPGVTVERKSGFFKQEGMTVEVVDLPGIYSLVMASDTASVDEKIACEYILQSNADLIVNILDASNLERNLYLTLQLLEMHVPMIIVLNMMDVARQRQIKILLETVSKEFGCPVIPVEAHKNKGLKELKHAIVHHAGRIPSYENSSFAPALNAAIDNLASTIETITPENYQDRTSWLALRLLEDDVFARQILPESVSASVTAQQNFIHEKLGEDADIMLADGRYRCIQDLMTRAVIKSSIAIKTWTARIDRVVLNRGLGIPVFLAVMYCMFLFAINIGGAFQDFFDIGSNTIFVSGLAQVLVNFGAPDWLTAILANGVGRGVNTTVTFIPVIGAMFLFLAFLEDSGYMARAAFVVDRGMRALGLPGKSFVPMIVGFGCNVPAVMATRTLENRRDRILTVMMSPFMSCGARLAIYAVFTAAFFPRGGQNVVFALYLIGIAMAMLTGLLLRKTLLRGEPSPLVMELPPYHIPNLKTLLLNAWQRLRGFLFRAGKLIVPICVLIGVLGTLSVHGSLQTGDGDSQSLLSAAGRFITPVFSPLGIRQDNWPATVGLITGVLAKEVVVGTLNALYSQIGHLAALSADNFSFLSGMKAALMSIPENLSHLGASLGNPVLAQAPVHTLNQSVYGLMYQHFDGRIGAFAYLLFVLLYFPCVSTTAAMLRELNRSWTYFSVVWTTLVAYGASVLFYQAATFSRHPSSSAAWVLGILTVLGLILLGVNMYGEKFQRKKYQRLLATGEVV